MEASTGHTLLGPTTLGTNFQRSQGFFSLVPDQASTKLVTPIGVNLIPL